MTILEITNRTENWKTARHFHPFFRQGASIPIARRLNEPQETEPGKVHLELYWRGMRDYLHKNDGRSGVADRDLAESYKRLFPDLRDRIEGYGGFRSLRPGNYDITVGDATSNLISNLVNTEIDIVLVSPRRLYVGEAKHEMSFGADGKLVLVHQLIRQYVMASVLIDRLGCEKKVVPFVVGHKAKGLKRSRQVDFMIRQGWMEEKDVLEWGEVDDLARKSLGANHPTR